MKNRLMGPDPLMGSYRLSSGPRATTRENDCAGLANLTRLVNSGAVNRLHLNHCRLAFELLFTRHESWPNMLA